jgi:hypothetical protein
VDEILAITMRVAQACEQLGLPYVVGGSLASSVHGIPRATQDVDFVVVMGPGHVAAFASALREEFYLDEDAMRDAVARQRSFNVVHLGTYFKADIFVATDDEGSAAQMERGQRLVIESEPEQSLIVASAEDVIAQKLYWYRLGQQTSERQWSDALGVLRVSGPRLELSYLVKAAERLGVLDLLHEAVARAGLELP